MRTWPKQQRHEVADGIVTIVNGEGEVGVSNASFIVEDNSAFVVDTMTFPEMARGMVEELARRDAHVRAVLNTHHHIDHIGGNSLFADARVVADPRSVQALQRLGFPTSVYDRLMPQFKGHFDTLDLKIPEPMIEPLIPPRGGTLHVFGPAHTAADVAVWFPTSRVLITGDLCFIGVTPLAVNGLISGWIAALDTLIALQPEVVIPGHGSIGTGKDLITVRDYFLAVQRIGQQAVEHCLSSQEALSLLDIGPVAEWIESERNLLNLERAMQEASGEINQTSLSALPPSARKI